MSERDFDVAGALASLRTAVRETVAAPAAGPLRRRAEQRLRARRLTTAVGAAVVVAAVVLAAGVVARRDLSAPVTPGTPTATTAPRPDQPVPPYPDNRIDDPIAEVDWADVTLTVPPRGPDCPSGRLRFSGGRTSGYPRMELLLAPPRPPAYGDMTGDGRAEAAIEAICEGDTEADHLHSQLLVVTRDGSGDLSTLGWVGPKGWGIVYGFWLVEGRLVVEPEPTAPYSTGQTLEYRWRGGRFERLDTGWPGIGPTASEPGPPIDLGPADGRVARTLGCPGGIVRTLPNEPVDLARAGGVEYLLGQPMTTQHVLDLAGDGHRYVLAAITCRDRVTATPPGGGSQPLRGHGVLVLDHDPKGAFRAVDLVPVPADLMLAGWSFDRGRLTLGLARVDDGTEAPSQRWLWNGAYFQRDD